MVRVDDFVSNRTSRDPQVSRKISSPLNALGPPTLGFDKVRTHFRVEQA